MTSEPAVFSDHQGPMPYRLAVLNSHPIQYFAPFYRYLHASRDISVTALYLSDFSLRGTRDPGFGVDVTWDVDLLEGYQSVFVGERAKVRRPLGFMSMIAPELVRALRAGGYDGLVVHGHAFAANWIAVAAAKILGIQLFLRCETHLGLPRSARQRLIRNTVISRFYKQFDRFLAIGSANSRYFRSLGIPDQKIIILPYSVDNKRFAAASSLNAGERMEIRMNLGVEDDRPIILFASKFQERKRTADLVKACAALKKDEMPFHLVLAGAGEQEKSLRQLAAESCSENVTFTGFVNQSQLPKIFGASDVFVLPSEHEPWGLIVNEAMAAGLPVIVSRDAGCVADLVFDGENGFAPTAGDIAGLAGALREIIRDPARRAAMGDRSRQIISQWDYETGLQGMRAAIASAGMPAVSGRSAEEIFQD